jgi:hypothetical protein
MEGYVPLVLGENKSMNKSELVGLFVYFLQLRCTRTVSDVSYG